MIRMPNSDWFVLKNLVKYFGVNTVLTVRFDRFDSNFMPHFNENFSCLSFRDGSFASTRNHNLIKIENFFVKV